ncbi:hypothetical protein REPUB_Repub05bG0074500 [Reevesia pubescens]
MAYFKKCLTEVDVKKQLAIPSYFIEHLPHYEGGRTIYFSVHEVSGDVWPSFGYYTRGEGTDYRKPVFQGDWRRYVLAKGLTPGDKIIFRGEENGFNGPPRYTIAAQKKVLLFGAIIGCTEEF